MDTSNILKFQFENLWFNPNSRFEESIKHIKECYQDSDSFFAANKFTNFLLNILTAKNSKSLAAKLFSAIDAMEELNLSINLSFMYLYKSSYDSLRRALEITVLGQFYESVEDNPETAFNWIKSKTDTPRFNKMVTKLSTNETFGVIDSKFEWKTNLLNHYWNLCDFCHTKGYEKSIVNLNQKSILKPDINPQVLDLFVSNYIATVQQIAMIYTVQNPILIVGLPTFEKFGLESKGLFSNEQADNLKSILPDSYRSYLINVIDNNETIQNRINEIKNLPDSEFYLSFKANK